MTIPTYSHCLTTIVEVYILFREQQSLQQPRSQSEKSKLIGEKRSPPPPLPHLPEVEEVLKPSISLPHDRSPWGSDEESLSKRARTDEVIEKNSELMEFYQAMDPHLFKDLIECLRNTNVTLRLMLANTDSGQPRLAA